MTQHTAFIIGAYAALPTDTVERDAFYRLLADQDWIDGLEIPYPGGIATDPEVVSSRLAPSWRSNTITAIPGTMQRLQIDATFGLASPEADGRAAALRFAADIRDRVARLAELAGAPVIRHVQLHSAPTAAANAEALADSLAELTAWDWSGAGIVIEHCDSHIPGQRPEKGFLALADEIDVAARCGVGIHINWGRSCLEHRDADAPLRDIVAAGEAGVLRGVLFSGASGQASAYGPAWADGHLPAAPDEPTSLMGAGQIAACAAAALAGGADYLGAKVCVPPSSTPQERVGWLRHVYDAALGQNG